MSATNEACRITAKYYDAAYAAKQDLVDAPFYVELARKHGGPVLEVGCGTGRLLLPIAREGIEIHGVDNSPAMLKVLKTHIENEPPEVRRPDRRRRGYLQVRRGPGSRRRMRPVGRCVEDDDPQLAGVECRAGAASYGLVQRVGVVRDEQHSRPRCSRPPSSVRSTAGSRAPGPSTS